MSLADLPQSTTTDPTDEQLDAYMLSTGALLVELVRNVPDPLHRLALLTTASNVLRGELDRTARECRTVRVPWTLIAEAGRMNSKQAAQARWGS